MNEIGKKTLRAGTWYMVCTFVLKALSFITMPLFTRLMSVADIGMYSNLSSWVAILGGVITLDLYSSVNLANFHYNKDLDKYLSSITIAGTVLTTLLYAVAIVFSDAVTGLLGIEKYMLHIMFVYFLVNPAILILHAKYRIRLQYRRTIITSLIPAGMSIICALLFVLYTQGDRLKARVFGYYGIWIAFAIVIYAYVVIKGKSFRLDYIKFAVPVAIPLVIHALANTILSTSDRVMIQRFSGSEGTAFYSVAYSCAMVVAILWTAINQAWAPWCYEMMHRNEEREIGRVAKPILLLFSALVLFIILLAPEILFIMGGEKYMAAIYVVPPVFLGYIAQMLYTLYVNIEYYNKKQRQIMVGTVIAALLNIVLNLIFIPRYGYVAAAYTTLVGYIALLFIHYSFVRKMGLSYIYDTKFNALLLFGMLGLGIFVNVLYNYTVARWIVITCIFIVGCTIIFARRQPLLQLLRQKDFIGILKLFHLL